MRQMGGIDKFPMIALILCISVSKLGELEASNHVKVSFVVVQQLDSKGVYWDL
jgi:hypothetical protein